MVAWSIVPPGSCGPFGEAGGVVVVVAEHPGNYRSWGLEDKVANRCSASVEWACRQLWGF
jgi:hypothetical protein